MSNGRPMDIHWTGGLDRTVGQAWSLRVGSPMDVPWMSIGQVDRVGQWTGWDSGDVHWTGGLDRWTGQDSGTSLVTEFNGRPMHVHWTGGLDRAVGQVWSVRVGCPMDTP